MEVKCKETFFASLLPPRMSIAENKLVARETRNREKQTILKKRSNSEVRA